MVLYADEIVDKNEEKVYNIQNNLCAIGYHVARASCLYIFVFPIRKIKNYFRFYFNRLAETEG